MVLKKLKSAPKTLPELIDRLTSWRCHSFDTDLLSELVSQIGHSVSELENSLQLLIKQLHKPQSQIRLNVVKVIQFLTAMPSQPLLSSNVREAVLLHLQDILPYCVPTTPADKALPPPESAAVELRGKFLKMLFQWERENVRNQLSSRAWGQLTSAMRYLRTPLEQGSGPSRLRCAAHALEALQNEELQRLRSSQVADAVIRRRLLAARDAYREHRTVIDENVRSLESVVKLIVPDPFEMEEASTSSLSSPGDFREHGFHASGDVNITFSLDFVGAAGNSNERILEIRLKLDDDTRILQESGQEFTNLALMHHRAILIDYIELSRIFADNSDLSPVFADDKEELASLLVRLDKAVNQFSTVRFIEETQNTSMKIEETDDCEEDFVEVPPISFSDRQTTHTASSLVEEKVGNKDKEENIEKPMAFLSDKLPWEMGNSPSSSFSIRLQTPCRSKPSLLHWQSKCRRLEPRRKEREESIISPSKETGPRRHQVSTRCRRPRLNQTGNGTDSKSTRRPN